MDPSFLGWFGNRTLGRMDTRRAINLAFVDTQLLDVHPAKDISELGGGEELLVPD